MKDSLTTFLSSCPVLQNLSIKIRFQDLEGLKIIISLPTLKQFQCKILFDAPSCKIKMETPNLLFCEFRGRLDPSLELENLPSLVDLELQIELLCRLYNQDGIIFSNLSCLKLYGGYSSRYNLLAVQKFLAMIPKLELLCFELTNRSSYYEIGDGFLDNPLSVPQWKLSSLITFCCKGFLGLRDEIEHTSQILMAATELKIL
ncbi:uncharacterized protein LOC142609229 [Castanea sativa]|uniref:uncharacterized protein LOC142609229 n=1 Tax=Castanea sativa TaxID=21020 RepID=UPI003F64A6F1